jgi:cell division protein FtsL
MKGRHFAGIILATMLTCAFVWTRLQIVSLGYDINELNRRERQVRDECNDLTLRINEAKSPQRLEQIARTRLNMQPPRPGQSVRL